MRILSLLLLAACGLPSARAVSPKEILFESYADFAEGTAKSVTLADDGTLAPAPALLPAGMIPAALADQVWAVVPSGSDLLAATSPHGQLLRISSGGKVESVAKFAETHLYAMARTAKGDLFVGTSPDGKVYRLAGGTAKPEVWFEPKAKYIWALALDKKGNLYAATGTEGKIFKITAQGKGEVFYASDEIHIRSLAFDRDGNLLAGSAEGGLLYRIAPDGTAVVLASTGRQEVNRIAVGIDGAIWFTATGPVHRPSTKAADSLSALKAALLSVAKAAAEGDKDAAAHPAVGADGNSLSQLWRIDASLYPELLWSTSEPVLTLDVDDSGARLGTGGEGYLYRIDARGHATRLLKLDGPAITAAVPSSDGLVLASSNPAALFRIGSASGRKEWGVYESSVVDSKGFAKWGAVRAEGKGTFRLSTRSGNTPEPDHSWYPWAELRDDRSVSPSARYVQFRLEIGSGNVERVVLSYLPKNLPPRIAELDVLAPGVGYLTVAAPPQNPQAKTADQLLDGSGNDRRPPLRYQPVSSRGYRTAVWKADDPNDDTLNYVLSYRSEGEKEWRVLAKDLSESVFSWDASGWPDGRYYLKLEASDAPDNFPDGGLTDEMESRLFVVDNTPPAIKLLSGGSRQVEFTVADASSGIGSVTVSKDGNNFNEILPSDGIHDPNEEKFSLKLDAGEILFIRAEDQAGNVSSLQVRPDKK